MDNPLLIIVVAFIILITFLQYFEDRFCLACLTYGQKVISIIIGATIIALFTEILDGAYVKIHSVNDLFVLIIPLSFMAFFLMYRHVFKHDGGKTRTKELNGLVKFLASFSDVLIGILVVSQIKTDIFAEVIFLVILLSYELIEQLSFHLIHEEKVLVKPRGVLKKVIFSSWALLGFLYAYFIGVSQTVSVVLFAIYAGAVFSLVVREIFSQERKIVLSYFFAGMAIFTILFFVDKVILL